MAAHSAETTKNAPTTAAHQSNQVTTGVDGDRLLPAMPKTAPIRTEASSTFRTTLAVDLDSSMRLPSMGSTFDRAVAVGEVP